MDVYKELSSHHELQAEKLLESKDPNSSGSINSFFDSSSDDPNQAQSISDSNVHNAYPSEGLFQVGDYNYSIPFRTIISKRFSESWTTSKLIKCQVKSITDQIVYCTCIVDRHNNIFETRGFPKLMFSQFKRLKVGKLVIVEIKVKPGASRIDIKDGVGLIDEKEFQSHADWESLRNAGLDKPFQG